MTALRALWINYKGKFMFDRFIKKPYYYIPPCPCCNSMGTGYYVKESAHDPTFVLEEACKSGELVIPVKELPHDNAFCLECGFTWHHVLKMKLLSLEEIKEQKRMRNTASFYNSIDFKQKSFLAKLF